MRENSFIVLVYSEVPSLASLAPERQKAFDVFALATFNANF